MFDLLYAYYGYSTTSPCVRTLFVSLAYALYPGGKNTRKFSTKYPVLTDQHQR